MHPRERKRRWGTTADYLQRRDRKPKGKALSPGRLLSISSFVISGLAFGVSLAGLLYTREQLKLSAGQIRSFVQVLDVTLDKPLPDSSFATVLIHVKNAGQTAAGRVVGEMDYRHGWPDNNRDGNSATATDFGALGPGVERTVRITHNAYTNRFEPPPVYPRQSPYYFYGSVWYEDDTTKEIRRDDWCYELEWKSEEDMKSTSLRQCRDQYYRPTSDRIPDKMQ